MIRTEKSDGIFGGWRFRKSMNPAHITSFNKDVKCPD